MRGKIILVFGIQAFGAVLSFLSQIYIAQKLSIEYFGQLGMIMNFVSISVIGLLFGIDKYILKNGSVYFGFSIARFKFIYGQGLFFLLLNFVLFSCSLLVLSSLDFLVFENANVFALIALLSLSNAMMLFGQNILRAAGDLFFSSSISSLIRPLIIIVLVFLLGQATTEFTVVSILSVYLISFSVIAGLLLLKLNQVPYLPNSSKKVLKLYKNGFVEGKHFFLNGIIQVVIKNLDLLFIGFFLSTYEAGLYSSVVKINLIILYGLTSMNIVFSPTIAKLFKERKMTLLNVELKKLSIMVGSFGLVLFVLVVVFGDLILGLFGEDYRNAFVPLIIVSGANCIETFFGPTGVILNMSGHQKFFSKLMFVIFVIYLILFPLLVSSYGILGVSIAYLVITVLKNVAQWIYIYKKIHLNTGVVGFLLDKMIKQ
jgi:O-antigen/teichoic acid export membrane protein